ncbi:MAG: aminotransferase class III-fold pyridoxal phosphate-dependent enzyme, partial [Mesorhizobium sp.]
LRDDATAKRTGDPSQTLGAVIADRALDHGLVLRSRGNLLAFCPPLIITPEEVDEMFDRFSKAICDVLEQ